MYRYIAAVCLLAICGCANITSSPVAEQPPSRVIEMEAHFVEVEGVKTVYTKTGPHRAIEYVLFLVVSPDRFEGRKILVSADKPHALPTSKGSSIRFRISRDHIPEQNTEKEISVTIRDIELASRAKDFERKNACNKK